MRDEPGLLPISEPPSLAGLERDERIDAMVNWFLENFEDPAHETMWDGREGGYQFGYGPYEAADYIYDAFPDEEEDEQQAAVEHLDAEGPQFAAAGHRRLPPDEDDRDYTPPLPLEERLNGLAAQLEVVRGHVEQLIVIQQIEGRSGTPGMGHNRPPEDDGDEEPNLNDVLQSIDEVQYELKKPNPAYNADFEVVQRAEGRFQKFLKWIKRIALAVGGLGVAVATGVATSVGKDTGDYILANYPSVSSTTHLIVDTLAAWGVALLHMF